MQNLAANFGHVGNNFQADYALAPVNDSFDMDIMMPPDINSIDSDLNKLGAMTPTPMQNNMGWGGESSGYGGVAYDFIGGTVSDFGALDQNMGY